VCGFFLWKFSLFLSLFAWIWIKMNIFFV
jgi:hypothetical protein